MPSSQGNRNNREQYEKIWTWHPLPKLEVFLKWIRGDIGEKDHAVSISGSLDKPPSDFTDPMWGWGPVVKGMRGTPGIYEMQKQRWLVVPSRVEFLGGARPSPPLHSQKKLLCWTSTQIKLGDPHKNSSYHSLSVESIIPSCLRGRPDYPLEKARPGGFLSLGKRNDSWWSPRTSDRGSDGRMDVSADVSMDRWHWGPDAPWSQTGTIW